MSSNKSVLESFGITLYDLIPKRLEARLTSDKPPALPISRIRAAIGSYIMKYRQKNRKVEQEKYFDIVPTKDGLHESNYFLLSNLEEGYPSLPSKKEDVNRLVFINKGEDLFVLEYDGSREDLFVAPLIRLGAAAGATEEDAGEVPGAAEEDDGEVPGASEGDDGAAEEDDGEVPGAAEGDDGEVPGASEGATEEDAGASEGDDGEVPGASEGATEEDAGASEGDDGAAEEAAGASEEDDGATEEDDGEVPGAAEEDDGAAEEAAGAAEEDDGKVPGASEGDDGAAPQIEIKFHPNDSKYYDSLPKLKIKLEDGSEKQLRVGYSNVAYESKDTPYGVVLTPIIQGRKVEIYVFD